MSDLVLGANEALVFPSGNGIDAPIVLDLRPVFKAEARLIELQAVTRAKAGELLHCFIDAWKEARTAQARASKQLVVSKRKLKEVRAEVVLDRALDVLKDKGLVSTRSPSGSEDLREAVVSRDRSYQAASERMEQIQAVVELMEIKAETMKMAYFAVNKLVDPVDRSSGSATSGGSGVDEPGAFTDEERVRDFVNKQTSANTKAYTGTGFGSPKL
jgi:hypothetical protein